MAVAGNSATKMALPHLELVSNQILELHIVHGFDLEVDTLIQHDVTPSSWNLLLRRAFESALSSEVHDEVEHAKVSHNHGTEHGRQNTKLHDAHPAVTEHQRKERDHGRGQAGKSLLENMYFIAVTLDVSHVLMSTLLLPEAQVQVRHPQ